MNLLPRIDEIEKLIDAKREEGKFSKNLEKELIIELSEIKILDKLIRNRIEKVIEKAIKTPEFLQTTENDEINFLEIRSKISREWFHDKVDRYYLERKEHLERVSFHIFRTNSKGIAIEAHQRLTEGEEGWQAINDRWGHEQEKKNKGRYVQMKPANMSKEIESALRRLQKGEVSNPIRTGKMFSIVELIDWSNAELSQTFREILEKEMFDNWMIEQSENIMKKLQK